MEVIKKKLLRSKDFSNYYGYRSKINFKNALGDETLRILIVAAVISIIIEVATADDSHRSTAWIEGFAIIVAVFICAFVTAANDYKKERQ